MYCATVVGEFPGERNFTGAHTCGRTPTPMYCSRAHSLEKAFYVCEICNLHIFSVGVVDTMLFFNVIVRKLNDVGFEEIGTHDLALKFFARVLFIFEELTGTYSQGVVHL